jgi:hypothetical protein
LSELSVVLSESEDKKIARLVSMAESGRSRAKSSRCLKVDERVDSCWSAPLHGDRLGRGEHTLDVEVCDEEGCNSLRSIRFVVDPTGRYTAIPRVEPLVTETACC